ncbi:MAG: PTS sugar transporter subunit IIA [Spirochaetota bacterium]|nr:PTS sugar transporter subunit IIA [Spirochaetota bacterium]
MFKLQDFVKPENVFFNLKSRTKRGILKEMVKLVSEVEKIMDQEESLLEHILNREKIESTGIGKGFAIPHCHFDGFKNKVKVYIGFPEAPIDFKSVDGAMVRIIFMIISDNNNNELYLKTLSRLMFLLRDIDIREKLFGLTSKEDFLKLVQTSDKEVNYIAYAGLKQLVDLLKLEDEIETYSRETLIEKGKRQGKLDLMDDSHYNELQKNHEHLVGEIDHRLLHIYNQLKKKFDGNIISKLHKNICSHCNVQLPIHIIREVNRENQIIQCNTCSKILVRTDR